MMAPRLSGTSLLQLSQTRMVFRATSFSLRFDFGEGWSVEKARANRKHIAGGRFAVAITG
jgi:hypothetical protein